MKKYTNIHITLAAFGQTLLALKIYSTCYVHVSVCSNTAIKIRI